MKIRLTPYGYVLIDDEDLERLTPYKWYLSSLKTKYPIAIANKPRQKGQKAGTIYMHRLIMNCPPGKLVDHINHNTLDNRKQNLRICTRGENNRNRKVAKNNLLGIKGVCKCYGRWKVQVYKDKKRVFCRTYPTIEEAKVAYNTMAKKYHQEFAYLNNLV